MVICTNNKSLMCVKYNVGCGGTDNKFVAICRNTNAADNVSALSKNDQSTSAALHLTVSSTVGNLSQHRALKIHLPCHVLIKAALTEN